MARFPRTEEFMRQALERREGSALAMIIEGHGTRWEYYQGLTAHPDAKAISRPIDASSLFDLASLTKALVTTPLVIQALEKKLFRLEDPVQKFFPQFPTNAVTLDHLLRHNSGLKHHEEFYRRPSALARGFVEKEEILEWILTSPLVPLDQAQVVYSDLGILLVGFLLENSLGGSIAELFQSSIAKPLGLTRTGFRPLPHASATDRALRLEAPQADFVATMNCPFRKRVLQGEVDDTNCFALGGATSHAGLFSTARETLLLLRHAGEAAQKFPRLFFPDAHSRPPFTRGYMLYPGLRPVPGAEWAGAIGHTGWVGTSAWFHPPTDSALVCLGNRVHPDASDMRFVQSRLEIQRAAWEELC